jgi:RNA polymerase sigma-70 factor (ECF subfamily)
MNHQPAAATESPARPALPEDGELVARVKAGDRAAFELLMRRYNQRLYRVTYSILTDAQAAEDCMQEAYVKAFHSLSEWGPPYQFGAWLTRISVNEALMQRRGQQRLSFVDPENVTRLSERHSEAYMSASQDPQQLAANQQLKQAIEAAIIELPDLFRVVFVLRGVEQLSVAETAATLNIPEATVKTRHHRARALLRTILERQIDAHSGELFEFAGARCDRMVMMVMERLA